MPSIFDTVGDPVTQGPVSVYDFNATSGEAFSTAFDVGEDWNPVARVGRGLRTFTEDLNARFGDGDLVSQDDAMKEVAGRGLDLKIPMGGITRYELDMLQYLKQREIRQQTVSARTNTWPAGAAGLAGSFAVGAVDPLNIASAFIPVVPEARYAQLLAQASGFGERAAIRAGVGAAEGAVGAAVIEPINYAGAQAQQADYSGTDSFINVMFGGVLGSGLHTAGGLGFDLRNSGTYDALKSLDAGLRNMSVSAIAAREAAANAPEHVHVAALHDAVQALENDLPVQAEDSFTVWHASQHKFDQPSLDFVTRGAGALEEGHGLYASDNRGVIDEYLQAFEREWGGTPAGLARAFMDDAGLSAEEMKVKLAADIEKAVKADLNPRMIDNMQAALEFLQTHGEPPKSAGTFAYEWQVLGKPSEFIDLETPISELPNVQKEKLAKAGIDPNTDQRLLDVIRAETDNRIASDSGEPGDVQALKALSDRLRAVGIKGGRYLTREDPMNEGNNYVIFDPKDVRPLSRNGEAIAPKPEDPRMRGIDDADKSVIREAEQAAANAADPTPEDIASDTEQFTKHLESMRSRGMVTEEMEAMLRTADSEAEKFEQEAAAYEAAAVCDLEPDA